MKQKRFLGFLPVIGALMLSGALYAQNDRALNLGSEAGQFGEVVNIALTLDSVDDVQGIVAAADWNDAVGTGVDILPGAAVADAEILELRIESNYAVIGVVIDINGQGPDAIPAGQNIGVATIQIECGGSEGSTPIEFRDNQYARVDGGPPLDNIIVVGGLSIGTSDGLELNPGELRCTPPPDEITVGEGENPNPNDNRCGSVGVMITNRRPVEGFVVAIEFDNSGGLVAEGGVSVSGAAAAADFAEFEISDAGVTAGVVIDLLEPFVPDFAIPPGVDQRVLTIDFCCPDMSTGAADIVTDLTLTDNLLGTPAKDNILVIGGQSIGVSDDLRLNHGSITCKAPTEAPKGDVEFHCSGRDGAPLVGPAGGSVEVCFGIVSREDNAVGHAQYDHIQGFSMAVAFCDSLSCEENLDIGGTILEALGAEFVSIQCDNSYDDGDGHELIIGVLIDALPPFDGATIAPSDDVQPIGYVTFNVADDAECDDVCAIEFVDNLNGNGSVPIKNLVSAENHSRGIPQEFRHNCSVRISAQERFHRGDCNFSLMGTMAVDIADAAAVVSYLFLPGSWQFQPGCLDACDCNDDGRVDLADSVCVLQYLFQHGAVPPAPGPGFDPDAPDDQQPGPGPDPTDDKLDCVLGSACVLVAH